MSSGACHACVLLLLLSPNNALRLLSLRLYLRSADVVQPSDGVKSRDFHVYAELVLDCF